MTNNELPKLKLTYFAFGGKAEPIRVALTALGIPFEDFRFKTREEFLAMKESGQLNFGQVPMLEVWTSDGKHHVLTQSAALMRFVAKLGCVKNPGGPQLYPMDDPVAAARVDAIMDQEADAFCGLRVAKYKERFGLGFLQEEKHQPLVEKITGESNSVIIPRHLGFLEKQLKANGTAWLAGTEGPSIADYFWVPVLRALQKGWSGDKEVLGKFQDLIDLVNRFMARPEVEGYYKNHKN